MKKKFFIILILLTLFLTSCTSDSDVRTYEVKEVPFYNLDPNYTVNTNKMNLYYFDGVEVPYMPVDEFVNDLDGMLDAKEYSFRYVSFIGEYIISTKMEGNDFKAVVDYRADKLYTQYLQVFENTKSSETTDYYSYLKQDLDTYDYDMKSIVLDFGKYDIDIICKDKKCYFPFNILANLFGGQNYANICFNGDAIYMTYFLGAELGTEDIEKIKKSSLTNSTPTEASRLANYNELLFMLDNFYGLKKYFNISSFDEYIKPEIKQQILSTSPEVFEEGYRQLVYGMLNECHTGLHRSSYYTGGNKVSSTDGFDAETSNFAKIRNVDKTLADNYKEKYAEKNYFEIKGDTAYITSFDFETGTKDQIFNTDGTVKEDAYKYDTFRLFVYAFEELENNSNVKNIVVDLSQNGGGNGAAMLRALGFLKQGYRTSIKNEVMGLTVSYKISIDTNMDDKYDLNDEHSNYNWYVLTSGGTYSAANIFASVCQNQGLAKIIGQKSGGGMCGVMPVTLMDGTSFQMSGASLLYVSIDDYNTSSQKVNYIEGGVEVDKLIDYEYFYDRDYINTVINNMN